MSEVLNVCWGVGAWPWAVADFSTDTDSVSDSDNSRGQEAKYCFEGREKAIVYLR